MGFKHPVMKIKPRAAKTHPTEDDALKAVANAVENLVIEAVVERMRPLVTEIVEGQELMDGPHEDAASRHEWESAVDDRIEEAVEPFVEIMSNDWMGENLTNTGAYNEEGINKFLNAMGREVFKQISYNKTPAKILSAVGVLGDNIKGRLEQHNNAPTEEIMGAQDTQNELETIAQKVAEHTGKDFDVLSVYDDIDMAADDDDILANGAASRIGLDSEDVETLRMLKLEHGDDMAQKICDLMQAKPKKAAKKETAKETKKETKPKPEKKTKDEAAEVGTVGSSTLVKFKDACSMPSKDLAELLRVSRPTCDSYLSGKKAINLSSEQYAALRGEIVTRGNALIECLAELDGAEAQAFLV